jgi:hypothetical protein
MMKIRQTEDWSKVVRADRPSLELEQEPPMGKISVISISVKFCKSFFTAHLLPIGIAEGLTDILENNKEIPLTDSCLPQYYLVQNSI